MAQNDPKNPLPRLTVRRVEAQYVATAQNRDDALGWLMRQPHIRRQLQDMPEAAQRLLVWQTAVSTYRGWEEKKAASMRRTQLVSWNLKRGMTRREALAAANETLETERPER